MNGGFFYSVGFRKDGPPVAEERSDIRSQRSEKRIKKMKRRVKWRCSQLRLSWYYIFSLFQGREGKVEDEELEYHSCSQDPAYDQMYFIG
jgi:hypothetical protein